MLRRYLLGTLLLIVPTLAFAQARTATPSVEGVWKIVEIVTTGANAATNSNPQPSLIILMGGYYSYISVNGTNPRAKFDPAKDPNKLTDVEKIARYEQWNPFTAQAGTYETKGTTLTRHPIVAKNVTVMTTDPPAVSEFRLEGSNLWLTTKSAAGQPASETRTKLVRVK
jgi:hypothetical protein